MLATKKSSKRAFIKGFILIPTLLIAVFLFSAKVSCQVQTDTSKRGQNVVNQSGVSPELLNEYEVLVSEVMKKVILKNGSSTIRIYPENLNIGRIKQIYYSMNEGQKAKATKIAGIIPRIAPPAKKSPSLELLNSWHDAKVYGIWVDGKRICNDELYKYQPSDIVLYIISKLEKNATNFGKHISMSLS
jgi:bla regulator protein blaR1